MLDDGSSESLSAAGSTQIRRQVVLIGHGIDNGLLTDLDVTIDRETAMGTAQ